MARLGLPGMAETRGQSWFHVWVNLNGCHWEVNNHHRLKMEERIRSERRRWIVPCVQLFQLHRVFAERECVSWGLSSAFESTAARGWLGLLSAP